MAAAFNGKWKVLTSDNCKPFFKSLGFTDEVIEAGKEMDDVANDLIDEIEVTGTDLKVTEYMKGKKITEYVYPLGKEIDQTEGKQTYKMVACIDGGCVKMTQKGDGYEAVYTRTIDGDKMTIAMDSNKGMKATRTLQKM